MYTLHLGGSISHTGPCLYRHGLWTKAAYHSLVTLVLLVEGWIWVMEAELVTLVI